MIAYQFNPATGEYIGETQLQASPLEPGKFFERPDATMQKPPEPEEHKVICLNGDVWEKKADYRQVPFYHKITKEQFTIEEIDHYPDPDWTEQDPVKVDLQYTKWDEVKSRWVYDAEAKAKADQEKINAEARAYLASSDWYVIRAQETGKEIPADILAARQAARDKVIE